MKSDPRSYKETLSYNNTRLVLASILGPFLVYLPKLCEFEYICTRNL